MMNRPLTAFFFLLALYSYGQESLSTVEIDSVVILSTRIHTQLDKSPVSIRSLGKGDIETTHLMTLKDGISTVPGVYAVNQYNSAQDLRISIRGFGARSAFGIRGVKILQDGIPLTTPDGQGQVDNVFFPAINKVEVLTGASSSMYGNASGGVIALTSFRDLPDNKVSFLANFGSFASYQASAEISLRNKGLWNDHQISYDETEGFRDHSASRNIRYNGRLKKVWKDGVEASLIVNLLASPVGQDPGGLNLASVEEDRASARGRNIDYNGGEELNQQSIAYQYNRKFGKYSTFKLNTFFTRRAFNNRLPFENGGQVEFDRSFSGLDASYLFEHNVGSWQLDFLAGVDLRSQRDDRKRFQNVEGERGDLSLDQRESFRNQAVYVLMDLAYGRWQFNSGLRFDRNSISVSPNFNQATNEPGDIILPSWSPSLSFSYRIKGNQFLRGSYSFAFETPTLGELGNRPDGLGGFNQDLKAQESNNYELGYRTKFSKRLSADVALFYIDARNELLPYEIEDFPGRTFYRNAGQTRRQGFELALGARPQENLNLRISYSYSDFSFVDFDDLDGKSLPGIPKHNFSSLISYQLFGWELKSMLNYYSSVFADSANEVSVPSYTIWNFSLGKKLGRFLPYFGINNLLGQEYFDNIRSNAFGGRFYEPAPRRNFYLGVKFDIRK